MSNKFLFTIPTNNKTIELPIELKWDFYGRDDSIELYEEDVIKDIIGIPNDFEVFRYANSAYTGTEFTDVNYNFHFFNGNPLTVGLKTANASDWVTSYTAEGFAPSEIYYYSKPFTKSFFKLDFYDFPDNKKQTNYFTIIIPVQQGFTENVSISPLLPNVEIRKPSFKLDYVGDKEGFFIYWLRKRDFLTLKEFYMSAKFFDGRLGVFVKMSNSPQSLIASPFNFDEKYFYYKVLLDNKQKTYSVYDINGTRVGDSIKPINWYEYINP